MQTCKCVLTITHWCNCKHSPLCLPSRFDGLNIYTVFPSNESVSQAGPVSKLPNLGSASSATVMAATESSCSSPPAKKAKTVSQLSAFASEAALPSMPQTPGSVSRPMSITCNRMEGLFIFARSVLWCLMVLDQGMSVLRTFSLPAIVGLPKLTSFLLVNCGGSRWCPSSVL